MTAELDEDSGIRLLSSSDSADDREQACHRAHDCVAGIDPEQRPFAALARSCCSPKPSPLQAISRGQRRITRLVARCTELGLPRLLADAGLG